MARFTDAFGRTWRLELDQGAAFRLRTYAGLRLPNVDLDLLRQPHNARHAIWLVVQPEALRRGLDRETFAAGLQDADVLGTAFDKLLAVLHVDRKLMA